MITLFVLGMVVFTVKLVHLACKAAWGIAVFVGLYAAN